MRNPVVIEDIEAMRRQEGIEDIELREAVRGLAVGDRVRITLLSRTYPSVAETVVVRITQLRSLEFRGTLATRPSSRSLSVLQVGTPVAFTPAHIHSIPRR
jgi:hypothetical protein